MSQKRGNLLATISLLLACGGFAFVLVQVSAIRDQYFADIAEQEAATALAEAVVEQIRIEAARPPDRYVAPAPIILPIF